MAAKRTLMFSSVPAPLDGFNFAGIQSKGFYGILPFVGDTSWGLTFCNCDDNVLTALIADRHYMEKPELFMEILNKNVRDFVAQGQQVIVDQISQKVANVDLLVCENDGSDLPKLSKL